MLGGFFALMAAATFAWTNAVVRRGVVSGSVSQAITLAIPPGIPVFLLALVISGKATVESDEGIRPVGPGDLIFIPAEEKHRLRATEPLFYFEFQAPNRFKTTILEGTDDDLRWERKDGRVWVQT